MSELSLRQLDQHRERWRNKPSLRLVHGDYLQRTTQALEIGGGCGILKDGLPHGISLDVQWTGLTLSQMRVVCHFPAGPFRTWLCSISSITRKRAMRVLRVGGRLIIIEPNVSPPQLLHEEPVILRDDLLDPQLRIGAAPYGNNQAVPYIRFARESQRLRNHIADLKILSTARVSLREYSLSGGFRSWSLLPTTIAGPLLRIERHLSLWLDWFLGFRLMVAPKK